MPKLVPYTRTVCAPPAGTVTKAAADVALFCETELGVLTVGAPGMNATFATVVAIAAGRPLQVTQA